MRRNNRKSNISETIVYLLKMLTIVPFLVFFAFTIIGSACLLLYFLIRHYKFTLFGIVICLISWFCINCIKQIRHKPTAKERTKRSISHKIFLSLNCILGLVCIVYLITLAPTLMSPPAKTTSHQPAETQAVSECLTEPKHRISLDRTVYVSRSGHKIHLHSGCSGMMYYVAMTYEEACEAGYSHCSRCFD